MSGKRQHYLPRFLLKGFASRMERNEAYTWVYYLGKEPYETNIRNIGLERYFYGAHQSAADAAITGAETAYSDLLFQLRQETTNRELNNPLIPKFIAHLVVRTKHARQTMGGAGDMLVKLLHKKLGSPEVMSNTLSRYAKEHPERVREIIREELQKATGGVLAPEQLEKLVELLMRNNQHLSAFEDIALHATVITPLLQTFEKQLPSIIERAHARALTTDHSPEPRVNEIVGLNWRLLVEPEGSFVLGDIGPVARTDNDERFKGLFLSAGLIREIYLPISDRQVIAGWLNEKGGYPGLDAINKASASLCREFFVAKRKTRKESAYASLIGSSAVHIPENEIDDI